MKKRKWPKEWPGVICSECETSLGCFDEDFQIVELTGGFLRYPGGSIEFNGVSSARGVFHGARRPIPLTPAAHQMLAIAKGRR